MSPSLAIVANNAVAMPTEARAETVSERVRRLQAEARSLAKEHILAFQSALAEMEVMAAEIAEGGEAYPPGVRDIARRLVEDCEARVRTLEAITMRG